MHVQRWSDSRDSKTEIETDKRRPIYHYYIDAMDKHGKTIGYLDKRKEMRRRSEIIPRRRTKKRCRRGGDGSISEHDKTPKGAASVRKLKETTVLWQILQGSLFS
ncbi:hypothetical protein B296_00047018 [Ensete ventricosum]|uniref:Uncharacterized protein n=1 Tax=Ensete ventricosum TaxID=4639 RepID=A0A426Z1E6_ENSVE|nr:hypothetical protein B296_00047018 [Ensete ventricosum]